MWSSYTETKLIKQQVTTKMKDAMPWRKGRHRIVWAAFGQAEAVILAAPGPGQVR